MTTFIETFKNKARNKQLTGLDFLARCYYKAATAKGENKEEILKGLVRKHYTPGAIKPHRPHPYHSAINTRFYLLGSVRAGRRWSDEEKKFVEHNGTLLGLPAETLTTPEELATIRELLNVDLRDL